MLSERRKHAFKRKKNSTTYPNTNTPYTKNLQSAKSGSGGESFAKTLREIVTYASFGTTIGTIAAAFIFPPSASPLILSSIITATIGVTSATYSSGIVSNIWDGFFSAYKVSKSVLLKVYNKSAEALSAVYAKISSDASRTRDYISKVSNECYIYLERYFYNLIMLLIIAVVIAFVFLRYVLNIQCQCKLLI